MNAGQKADTQRNQIPGIPTFAWQPLTPRGVAAFAKAGAGRVLTVQLVFAALVAASVIWFLHDYWFPTVREAIRNLPQRGNIRRAQLNWYESSPKVLSSSQFLSIAVDLDHSSNEGREAHVAVEFGRNEWRVNSLFGYLPLRYPKGLVVSFNRPELEPWWGAWEPMIFAAMALCVVVFLMLTWVFLAVFYSIVPLGIAFYADRRLGWRESWKLCSAALLPGAAFMILALVAYGLGWIDLIRLGFALAFHVLIGWVFVCVSPLFLPRDPNVQRFRKNPFGGSAEGSSRGGAREN